MRIDPAEVGRLILAGEALPPEWIPHIVELRLERSYITDLRPVSVLTGLRRLMLTRSRISDIAPLAALTRLRHLHLSFTAVSDVGPLMGMAELEGCFLTGSLVNDIAPLAGLVRLERLDLGGTRIGDTLPLAELHNLRSLDLSGTLISDVTPLAGLTRLQFLDLTNTPVTDLAPLGALKNLRWLNLRSTQGGSVGVIASARLSGHHLGYAAEILIGLIARISPRYRCAIDTGSPTGSAVRKPSVSPSSTRHVILPPNTAPVSMAMRLCRTTGSLTGEWPCTTTAPKSISE